RLMTGRRKVDDCQPAMTKSDAGLGCDPGATIVGAAVVERVGNRADRRVQDASVRSPAKVDDTCDTAHGSPLRLREDDDPGAPRTARFREAADHEPAPRKQPSLTPHQR